MSEMSPQARFARDEQAAANWLMAECRTDGLPVIVPTQERVERMLLCAGDLGGDIILGDVGPSGGCLTIEKAAINAVMAGCEPEIFPLVIAACEALVDPVFDAGPMQSTTHCVTPLIIVNGPARKLHDIACGIGALGPGHRSNATLGRALRLIMLNVGGGLPGVGDMATLGSPAKFTCCLGEAEEENPFGPYHVSRGFAPTDSTVTLLGVEGPHSFVFSLDEYPSNEDYLLRTLAAGLSNPCSNNIYFGKGMVAVVLNPTHARILAKKGLTRRDVQERLFEYASTTRTALSATAGPNLAACSSETLRIVPSPAHIMLIVAGEETATYSAYFPTWGCGVDGQHAVTKRVRYAEVCETPESKRR